MSKHVWKFLVGLGLVLPVIAAPASCSNPQLTGENLGPTILKYFANEECLEEAGIERPQ